MPAALAEGRVVAVCTTSTHTFTKTRQAAIKLQAGRGVQDDVHNSPFSTDPRAKDPQAPNLRQVHLLASERLAELQQAGFELSPGQIGENVTTSGVELHSLPLHTELHLGTTAVVKLTGLRNPCAQLSKLQKGLMQAMLQRDTSGQLHRKAGVLGTVESDGAVSEGDRIVIRLPARAHEPLPVLY